ncbi:MAG: TetR/AcrR family transcriptional regulator [Clostridium sp.]
MGKAFTDEEKKIINERLIETGIRFIGKYGYKKMSIDVVAKEVGISKGAFYRFFLSKEIFFFRIFEYIEKKLKVEFIEAINGINGNTKEDFIESIYDVMKLIEGRGYTNVINMEIIESVIKFLPKTVIDMHFKKDVNDLKWMLDVCKEKGFNFVLEGKDKDLIASMLRTIFVLFMHDDLVGNRCDEVIKRNIGLLYDELI